MRVFYNPVKAVKNIFSPPKPKPVVIQAPQPAPVPAPVQKPVTTPEQDEAADAAAREEAERRTRAAAANTGGRRSTLLTGAEDLINFGNLQTRRRTLLGGS